MLGPVGEKSGDESAVGADVAGREGVGCTVERGLCPGLVAADVLQAETELVGPEVAGLVERLAAPEEGAGDSCSLRGRACPVLTPDVPVERRPPPGGYVAASVDAGKTSSSVGVGRYRCGAEELAGGLAANSDERDVAGDVGSAGELEHVWPAAEPGPDAFDGRVDSDLDAVRAIAIHE